MKIFIDTNLVVAVCLEHHEHQKVGVERLYCWNARHLQTVASEDFRRVIVVP